MLDLITRLFGIVLLRLGPQDLPANRATLLACIVLYLIVTAINLASGNGHPKPVLLMTLAVALPLVLCWIVLNLRQRAGRWQQTVAALFGTSALLSILTLPLTLSVGEGPSPVLGLLLLAGFFWSLAVDAHIWRHALDVAFSTGLLVAVILLSVSLFVISSLAGRV